MSKKISNPPPPPGAVKPAPPPDPPPIHEVSIDARLRVIEQKLDWLMRERGYNWQGGPR